MNALVLELYAMQSNREREKELARLSEMERLIHSAKPVPAPRRSNLAEKIKSAFVKRENANLKTECATC